MRSFTDTDYAKRLTRRWLLALAIIAESGCALPTGVLKSRWAMDDPEYAAK